MTALDNRERDTRDYPYRRSEPRSDYREESGGEREISLGTGTILAIFFALALVCAACFGLGYSMGRRSAQAAASVPAASGPAAPNSTFGSFKPPAGSPATQRSSAKEAPEGSAPTADTDGETVAAPASISGGEATDTTGPVPESRKTAAPVGRAGPRAAQSASPGSALGSAQGVSQIAAMPAIDPNGTAMVQVAAVSHQEDADMLVTALKKRGYTVFIRQEAQNKLFHVQLGPFATKKDADAMRQRLLADGYIAIVK